MMYPDGVALEAIRKIISRGLLEAPVHECLKRREAPLAPKFGPVYGIMDSEGQGRMG
jgi:hypothetical protein